MGSSYRVPGADKMRLHSREMALGGAFGFAMGVIIPGNGYSVLFFLLLGLAAGAWFGMKRQSHEKENGRLVKAPGFWNRAVPTGIIIGSIIGVLATMGIAAVTMSTISTASASAIGPMAVTGVVASMGTLAAGPLLGAYIGGAVGVHHQNHHYALAQEYVLANGEYRGKDAPALQLQQEAKPELPAYAISHEEAQNLAARLEKDGPSHADKSQERTGSDLPKLR